MKFASIFGLTATFAGTSVVVVNAAPSCEGKEEVKTKIDFFDAELIQNDLHVPDQSGRLRYEGVGLFKGDSIDLVVTQNPDSPPYSTDMSIRNGYNRGDDPENPDTRWERFGNINVMTKDPRDSTVSDEDKALMNGEGTFDFCFYYTGTEELATVDSFDWSVYDLDWRNNGGLNEKFTIDTAQAQQWTIKGDTEVKMWCENKGPSSAVKSGTFSYTDDKGNSRKVVRYVPPTCDPGVKTIFHSTSLGRLEDNPTDPENLTKQQLARSIEFRFENTSCWTFKYEHYCPCGNYCDEDGGGPSDMCNKNEWCPKSTKDHKNFDPAYPNACKSYTGGNFLFAGTADEKITEEGECITPSPTPPPEPTEAPTLSPVADTKTPPPEIECVDDVTVLKKTGETEFPLVPTKPLVVVDGDGDTHVTVNLKQPWTSEESSVSHVFASYRETMWDQVCLETNNPIGGGTVFDTITVQCNVMSPKAYVEICVADDLSNGVLSAGDDAEIPECCHPDIPPNHGIVCYTLEINCNSECIQQQESQQRRGRHLLRGGK